MIPCAWVQHDGFIQPPHYQKTNTTLANQELAKIIANTLSAI